jgi:hypothetical protein
MNQALEMVPGKSQVDAFAPRTSESDASRSESARERVRTRSSERFCQMCGQAFKRVRPHQKYCTDACRLADFKRRSSTPSGYATWDPDPARPD